MKKLLLPLLLLFVSINLFAQSDKRNNYSMYAFVGTNIGAGFEGEYLDDEIIDDTYLVIKAAFTVRQKEFLLNTAYATGSEAEFGIRNYFKEDATKGFYYSNYLVYGINKFKESYYSGKYRYFSFVAPEFGYKFKIKRFSMGLNFRYIWKIEIKGTDDVDNKYFNNYDKRLGLHIGYEF